MPQGTLTITGSVTGLPSGMKTIAPPSIVSANAVAGESDLTLASGDNTIAIPTGATAVVITPPPFNTVALKIKGVTGNTGILVHPSFPTVLALGVGATLILNAAALVTAGSVEINFL